MKSITYDEWYELLNRIKELETTNTGFSVAVIIFGILTVIIFGYFLFIDFKRD